MIPEFPGFRDIQITDRSIIEVYTHRYPPYSDFDFTSLWSWDTRGERMISKLNGNLVIRFADYHTHEPFLSFLGNNEPDETAGELISYAKKSKISLSLHLVPEESISGMKSSKLKIKEDRNNFDYIYSISELGALDGVKTKKRKRFSDRFLHQYPQAHFEIRDLGDKEAQKQVSSVLRTWENRKKLQNKTYQLEHEEAAINRLFETADSHNLILSTIVIDGVMRAFSIDELIPNKYCMGHFWKADNTCAGIYDFFIQKIALYLGTQGVEFWNFQQDLGIENLRHSKMRFSPAKFLKKYTVSLIKENKVISIFKHFIYNV